MPAFGEAIREEFLLGPGVVQVNNGSYGTLPKRVRDSQRRLLDEIEENADNYFRWKSIDLWKKCIAEVAEFVGANPENLCFVDNATTGVNTAVKSLHLGPGDALLANTWTYNPLKYCCRAVAEAGADLIWLPLKWPVESKESVVGMFQEYLEKHPHIKVAIVDHITSATATVMPIKEIISLCHKHGVVVIIDGAHAPGQLNLNLEETGADFYTGNLHKWLFAPRGCGFLYVHPKHHKIIHSTVTSVFYKNTTESWRLEFYWQGTRDNSACAASVEGIKFHKYLGGMEALHEYNCKLLDDAVALLVDAWDTEKFPIPREMEAPFMRLVRLPDMKCTEAMRGETIMDDYTDITVLMETIWQRYKLTTVTIYIQGAPWVRLSAQVYNTLDEYRVLAEAILALKAEGF